MTVDDPIAEALLSDSPYERLRAREFSVLGGALPRKLAWQSYLLLSLAALLPIVGLLPAGVREAYAADAALAAPRWAVVALFAVGAIWLTGLGHAGVALRLLRLGPAISEVQARELLSLENVCSLFGFGTAGFAVLVTYAFVALGFAGLDTLTAYAAVAGNPFAPSPLPVSIGSVAIAAMVGAVVLKFLSAYVYVESLCRGRSDVRATF